VGGPPAVLGVCVLMFVPDVLCAPGGGGGGGRHVLPWGFLAAVCYRCAVCPGEGGEEAYAALGVSVLLLVGM
jgi:hypothetical protein